MTIKLRNSSDANGRIHIFKSGLAALLTAILILNTLLGAFGTMPTVFAATSATEKYGDISGHWGIKFIEKWSDYDLIAGFGDGTFRPDAKITKAQFYVLLVNSMVKAQREEVFSYSDINWEDNLWYTVFLRRATALGISIAIDNKVNADAPITRGEVAYTVAELFELAWRDGVDHCADFSDSNLIPQKYREAINVIVENGIMGGNADGSFGVDKALTRIQALVILNNCIGTLVRDDSAEITDGIWSKDTDGNLFVHGGINTISGCTIDGNLYISGGMEGKELRIENVTVNGDIVIFGGSAEFVNCKIEGSIIKNISAINSEVSIDSATTQRNYGSAGGTTQTDGIYTDKISITNYKFEKYTLSSGGRFLTINGVTDDPEKQYIMLQVSRKDEEYSNDDNITRECFATDINGNFSGNLDISKIPDGTYYADVFTGAEMYGVYNSWVFATIQLEIVGGVGRFPQSPVYEKNIQLYDEHADVLASYTLPEYGIESDASEIIALAREITAGISDDYMKVLAIHDYVADNIYYDFDNMNKPANIVVNARDVLKYKRTVCQGYSYLSAALIRSLGIPCRVVIGYALGIDNSLNGEWPQDALNRTDLTANHAWNEVYISGRWIIMDVTWDSTNKYENGTFIKSGIHRTYFDSSAEFFAGNHMSIEYTTY